MGRVVPGVVFGFFWGIRDIEIRCMQCWNIDIIGRGLNCEFELKGKIRIGYNTRMRGNWLFWFSKIEKKKTKKKSFFRLDLWYFLRIKKNLWYWWNLHLYTTLLPQLLNNTLLVAAYTPIVPINACFYNFKFIHTSKKV